MARLVRSDWPLLILVAVGAVLRIATSVAYRPAMAFLQDSFDYLNDARQLQPGVVRPLGYPLFLRALAPAGQIQLVPVVQHLLGLGVGVAVYLLLRHLGVRSWVAGLGAAPVLLDGYQIYLEHFVMAETLFTALVVAAVVLLLRSDQPGAAACAAAGAVLAGAALTRSIGLLLVPVALGFLVARRVGPMRVASAAGAALAVLGAYAAWFSATHGPVALQAYSGYFLAGRVQPFADCDRLRPPPDERPLCDPRPAAERPSADWYVWNPASPLRRLDGALVADRNALAARFARRVILRQPGDYVSAVASDAIQFLSPGRRTGDGDFPVAAWQFRTDVSADPWRPVQPPADPYAGGWTWPGPSVSNGVTVSAHGFALEPARPAMHGSTAAALARYQRYGYTAGPFLLAGLLLGLLAGAGRLTDPRHRRLRHAGALFAVCGVAVLVGAAATSVFDFRYLLPALVLLPPAGAVGVTLLLERRSAS
ncbi:MAG: hypothetical protein ACR2KK_20440 [Acidimicrobiales bacterium]